MPGLILPGVSEALACYSTLCPGSVSGQMSPCHFPAISTAPRFARYFSTGLPPGDWEKRRPLPILVVFSKMEGHFPWASDIFDREGCDLENQKEIQVNRPIAVGEEQKGESSYHYRTTGYALVVNTS